MLPEEIIDFLGQYRRTRMTVFECFGLVTKETTTGGGALPILDQAQHYGDRKVCIVL
jgi:hypothetical protein